MNQSHKLIVTDMLQEAAKVLNTFLSNENNISNIESAAQIMAESLAGTGKILACGNGGSYCDAQHFAEELTGRFRKNRKALGAIVLGDAAHITCTANDYGFEYIFSRGVEALGRSGDVLLAISTSGNSANVLNAVHVAKQNGIKVIHIFIQLIEEKLGYAS